MAVRKIKKSYILSTEYFSSFKNKRQVVFETILERDIFMLLKFNSTVISYEEQPFRTIYQHHNKTRRYTPDVKVTYYDNSEKIFEVKYFNELDNKKELQEKLQLSFKSGFSKEVIFNMTLRSLEGIVADHIIGKSNTQNIRALGNYCHIETSVLSHCSEKDDIPYFRKEWRLTFYTHCLKYSTKLLDRCSSCLSPLTISKSYEENSFIYCFKCGEKYIFLKYNFLRYSFKIFFYISKYLFRKLCLSCKTNIGSPLLY